MSEISRLDHVQLRPEEAFENSFYALLGFILGFADLRLPAGIRFPQPRANDLHLGGRNQLTRDSARKVMHNAVGKFSVESRAKAILILCGARKRTQDRLSGVRR